VFSSFVKIKRCRIARRMSKGALPLTKGMFLTRISESCPLASDMDDVAESQPWRWRLASGAGEKREGEPLSV